MLMRMARMDVVTARLASMPMGPVESATLAARLVGEACPGASGLAEHERARLRAIAAGRGD